LQKLPFSHPGRCAFALLAAAAAAGCEQPAAEVAARAAAAPAPVYACGRGGFLDAEVLGAVSMSLDWAAESLSCEGMPRPAGEGARLRFAGAQGSDAEGISIIIALPSLQRGATGRELATNATLVIEGDARFFSTSGDDVCWTDVVRNEPLSDDRFAVSGTLYCIAPLVEVNGDGSVSIPELRFSGLLEWSAP